MTMAVVVSTYLFGLPYFAATGVCFFYDSYIPIAVFPGMPPAVHRPVHVAAHGAGAHRVRGALRAEHGRAVGGAGAGRGADRLRQAAAGAVAEPVGDPDRPGGAVDGVPAVRSGGARAHAGAAAAAPGVHGGVGRRVRRDERNGRGRGPASRPVGAVLAAGLPGRAAARAVSSLPSGPVSATWVPGGRATRRGCCRRRSQGADRLGRLGRLGRVMGRSRRCSRSSGGVSSGSSRRAGTIG